MAKKIENLVEYIGISDTFPKSPTYFTETTITQKLDIPIVKPDIGQLLGVMVDTNVISRRVIDTSIVKSNEGQNLSGCKLVVELNLYQKVRYVAKEIGKPVHVAKYPSLYESIFIIVPCQINGTDICDIIRKNRIAINVYVEDINAQVPDVRTVFTNTTVLVDVILLP